MEVETPQKTGTSTKDLKARVREALRECAEHTGSTPTSGRYKEWRSALEPEQRAAIPSMTSVVPLAYSSWAEARRAAGLEELRQTGIPRGPKPSWEPETCLQWVHRWQASDTGTSLVAFNQWLAEQRRAGISAPSASTIRLRLRMPWSTIMEKAATANNCD